MHAHARQRSKTNWMCLIRCITRFRSKRFRFIRSFDRTICDCCRCIGAHSVKQNRRTHGGVSTQTYGAHIRFGVLTISSHIVRNAFAFSVWNDSPTHSSAPWTEYDHLCLSRGVAYGHTFLGSGDGVLVLAVCSMRIRGVSIDDKFLFSR